MILADTSAWVEFDRRTGSAVHLRVRALIAEEGPLAVCQPVVAEVAMGARTDHREVQLRRLLARATALGFDAASDFDAGASIYRRCRSQGITPRGLVDCVVAAVALRHGATLLCADVDLVRIAEVMAVPLDDAVQRAPGPG